MIDYTDIDNFEYQYVKVLQEMKKIADEQEIVFDSDFVWENLEELGKLFYNTIHNYTDIENAISLAKEMLDD